MNELSEIMVKGSNRASQRSRRRIVDALLNLLEVSSLSKISIREIADKADLVRRTFYSHFSSKEEVLRSHFESLCVQLIEHIMDAGNLTLGSVTQQFFSFWRDHAGFLRILKKNGLAVPNEALEDLIRRIGIALPMDRMESAYAKAFLAGGLVNILEIWVDRNCKESPEAMSDELLSLVGF